MMPGFYKSAYGVEAIKDPDAVRDYSFWWGNRLSTGVTVASVAHTVPVGLTMVSQGVNGSIVTEAGKTYAVGTITTVRLSGGTDGTRYTVVCRATLSNGEVDDQSFIVDMRSK